MRANFTAALQAVLAHEGGYCNDPADPGGATNRGVTQKVYDTWRADMGLALRSVKLLTAPEIMAIYKRRYWDAVRGDELPSGVDYATFDFAVNSGPARAAKFLQRCAGLVDDGKLGPASMAAIAAKLPAELIADLCSARQHFLEGLPTFPRFGRGWTRRVDEVRLAAEDMA